MRMCDWEGVWRTRVRQKLPGEDPGEVTRPGRTLQYSGLHGFVVVFGCRDSLLGWRDLICILEGALWWWCWGPIGVCRPAVLVTQAPRPEQRWGRGISGEGTGWSGISEEEWAELCGVDVQCVREGGNELHGFPLSDWVHAGGRFGRSPWAASLAWMPIPQNKAAHRDFFFKKKFKLK